MLRFSANLGFLWSDKPLVERIARAAAAGFKAVETHAPDGTAPETVRDACGKHGVKLLGINTPRGDSARDDNGLAALPDRRDDFRELFLATLDWQVRAGGTTIHVQSGTVKPIDKPQALGVLLENLAWASDLARRAQVTILLEALNPRAAPGYFYSRIGEVSEVIARLGDDNIKIMFDVHHVGVTEGDVLTKLECYMPWIGHVQIAAVPSRAEPDEGEIDYRAVFKHLESLNYSGWIGAEYRPRTTVEEGLSWVRTLGVSL